VFVIDVVAATDARNASALTHALEEIAQHSRTAVVVLFPELPPFDSAFDRILYGARRVIANAEPGTPIPRGKPPRRSAPKLGSRRGVARRTR
jgi:anti-anti-sigma regulatory factor